MIVDHGIVSPVNVSDVDPPEEEGRNEDEDNQPKMELSVGRNAIVMDLYKETILYLSVGLSIREGLQ